MELSEIIGENLRVIMVMKQRRVGEFAKETGISRNTITLIRNGKFKMIRTDILSKLAQCLEITVAQLVTEKAFYKGGDRHHK